MHFFVYIVILFGVVRSDEDSKEKEIKKLPENARRMFLDNVANRLLKGVNGTGTPQKGEIEISDDQLSENSNLVQKAIEEEKLKLQNSSKKTTTVKKDKGLQPTIDKKLAISVKPNDSTIKTTTPKVQTTTTTTKATKATEATEATKATTTVITTKEHSTTEETTTKVTTVEDTTTPKTNILPTYAPKKLTTIMLANINPPPERLTTQRPADSINSSMHEIASKIPKYEVLKLLLKRFGYNDMENRLGKVYEVFEHRDRKLPITFENFNLQPVLDSFKKREQSSLSSSTEESSSDSIEDTLLADKINIQRGVKPELMKVLLKFMSDVYNKKSILRNKYKRNLRMDDKGRFRSYKESKLDTDYFYKMNDENMYRRGNIQRTRTGNDKVYIRMLNILQNVNERPPQNTATTAQNPYEKYKKNLKTKVDTAKSPPREIEKVATKVNTKKKQTKKEKTVPIIGLRLDSLMTEISRAQPSVDDFLRTGRRRDDVHSEAKKMAADKMLLDSFLTVIKDMIEKDQDTLSDYNWMDTTVDILAALAKLHELIQNEESNNPIHADDMEVLNFIRSIFKSAFLERDEKNDNDASSSGKKIQYMIIKKKSASANIDTKRVVSQLLKYYVNQNRESNDEGDNHGDNFDLNMVQSILYGASRDVKENKMKEEFKKFLNDVGKAALHLHLAVIEVIKESSLRDQAFYFQLKENFLEHATDAELIGVLVHLFTADYLQSIGKSYRSGMAYDPDTVASINKNERAKAVDSMTFAIRLLKHLKS